MIRFTQITFQTIEDGLMSSEHFCVQFFYICVLFTDLQKTRFSKNEKNAEVDARLPPTDLLTVIRCSTPIRQMKEEGTTLISSYRASGKGKYC